MKTHVSSREESPTDLRQDSTESNCRQGQSCVNLATFDNRSYYPGRGHLVRGCWYVISLVLFESGWFPFSRLKSWILRRFGARIGKGLVIKPTVRIKYPWRLSVGVHCWIGQDAWIDNLADVTIGDHVCISQGAYLCTGSHDHRRKSFDLITRPISIASGAWLGAKSIVLPGCVIGENAIIAAGSVARSCVEPREIVAGNPAEVISLRNGPEKTPA